MKISISVFNEILETIWMSNGNNQIIMEYPYGRVVCIHEKTIV